ncbi:MAG: mRNA interferase MazF [Blastocatellia bacterium]|nr:mRNA interferase MazF [Blastocatellia bacterium]
MMKIGTMPKQGDILLIPIPFTDLSSQKRRPVIVISNDQYNRKTGDIIVVAMTSNPQVTDYSLSITSSDLIEGALNRPGKIRVDKIYTLSQAIVAKTFGQVDDKTLSRIRRRLANLVASTARSRIKR